MANLYRDIHQTVKQFSIENKLNLRLMTKIKLKCHFYSKTGDIKTLKLHGGGADNHYVIIIRARNEILSGRDLELFKELVDGLINRLKVYFPDVALATPWSSKPIQHGHVKLKLTNVKDQE